MVNKGLEVEVLQEEQELEHGRKTTHPQVTIISTRIYFFKYYDSKCGIRSIPNGKMAYS